MSETRFRTRTLRLPAALSIAAALALSIAVSAQAPAERVPERVERAPEPASEGRPITPAGVLIKDAATGRPAVLPLTFDLVRSTDGGGPDGKGRYLIAINSGYGVEFSGDTSQGQQSLSVIDLGAGPDTRAAPVDAPRPTPLVIQNVYFPTPQSANVGIALSPRAEGYGGWTLYVSGGVENKIWVFRFTPGSETPITPPSPGPATKVDAPFIDVSGFAGQKATQRYNDDYPPVYPAGLALSPDGTTLFVANNLADSLGIISRLHGARELSRVDLRRRDDPLRAIYPYGVVVLPARDGKTARVYVSCWNDSALAVVDPRHPKAPVRRIAVDRHPTAMILDAKSSRLYVVNSDADTVSVVDTRLDKEIERI